MFYLNEEFAQSFDGADPFKTLRAMEGNIYRQFKSRKTFQFSLNGKSYFAKLHTGIGWAEILKNILQFRLPIVGAGNEWRAIHRLQELDIATLNPVAYGSRGINPACRESFIITEELCNTVSLEDFCKNWKQDPPDPQLRWQLIKEIARISKTLHCNGVCHRDYYLCHFLLHKDQISIIKLSLIDLHRALVKTKLARRWIIKDIAGLYYSSMNLGLTKRDLLRFIRHYSASGLRMSLTRDKALWQRVEQRAQRMYENLGPSI